MSAQTKAVRKARNFEKKNCGAIYSEQYCDPCKFCSDDNFGENFEPRGCGDIFDERCSNRDCACF